MSDESLYREVDEEVRADEMKKLWQRYGSYFTAAAIAIVLAVSAYKGWQYYEVKQSEAAAAAYFAAARAANAEKGDEALRNLAAVNHKGYAALAKLREAGLLAKAGKTAEAVALYEGVSSGAIPADGALQDIARIKAAYLQADTLNPDELIGEIGQFDKDGNPYRNAAREVFGLAAFRTADYTMSKRYMEAIAADKEATAAMRKRANIFLQLMEPLTAR